MSERDHRQDGLPPLHPFDRFENQRRASHLTRQQDYPRQDRSEYRTDAYSLPPEPQDPQSKEDAFLSSVLDMFTAKTPTKTKHSSPVSSLTPTPKRKKRRRGTPSPRKKILSPGTLDLAWLLSSPANRD